MIDSPWQGDTAGDYCVPLGTVAQRFLVMTFDWIVIRDRLSSETHLVGKVLIQLHAGIV